MGKQIPRPTFLVLLSFFVVAVALAGYFYFKYQQVAKGDNKNQVSTLVRTLSSTISLPAETPTVAQVTDKTKLGNAVLAQEAENGDQILIFSKAKKAILYRPSTKKVIDMYPLSSN